ncbi:SusC/RagA family TonB-linked outer membrane protein [Chitinophaga silvatica]|nr:SusC/RagA family TonB-linked outer membrane protein [Chitinophaga silvatica]
MRAKYIPHKIFVSAFVLLSAISPRLSAQQAMTIVKGKITDQYNRPLSGVVVNSLDGKTGTSTNRNGEFQFEVVDDSQITVYQKGFLRQAVKVKGGELPVIVLQPDVHKLDEVVALGLSKQLRREVTGAVSTVSGEELQMAPVANLGQTLAGRLSGLTAQETYSEPSRATTQFNVRGYSSERKNAPLVVIDGIPSAYNTNQTLEYISPSEIESISVLKDASTQAIYGIQGANGVIVIQTKRGKKGTLKTDVRLDQSFQQVTTKPTRYSSYDYARLMNEAAANDSIAPIYSQTQLDGYKNGTDAKLYPNNDWYDRYFRDFALMQRVNVGLTGGNDRVVFYSNLNVMHQGGQYNTDQPKYKTNPNNIWVNYRTNMDMYLHKYIKAYLSLAGNIKRERVPNGASVSTLYSSMFQTQPNVFGPLSEQVLGANGKVLDPGGNVVVTKGYNNSTYGMLNRSGFTRHTVTNIVSQAGLDVDLSWITQGLNLSGTFAYQTNSVGSLNAYQDYERYFPDGTRPSPAGTNSSLAYSKSHSLYYHLDYNARLNYNRAFDKHNVSAFGYIFYQNLTKADNSTPNSFPYNRLHLGAELAYNYANRYFAKFDLGYSGSEQFSRGSRYTSTPSVAVAWEMTNENFLKSVNWLTQLKPRVSWGKTATDQIGGGRFAYLDDIRSGGGGPIGSLGGSISENALGNPFISAEISTKKNAGIDIGLFNALSLSFDIFSDRMDNMLVGAVNAIPAYQGFPLANYPRQNMGIFTNKGYEIGLNYTKSLNKDLTVSLGGMLSYQKNTVISWNEANKGDGYAYRYWSTGYSLGQAFTYLVDYSNGNGIFNSRDEINKRNLNYTSLGKVRVGDLIYQDLNGDGIINDKDKAPVGTGDLPRKIYSITGGVRYKAFDLNFMFQGVGEYKTTFGGLGINETANQGMFGAIHANAWTAAKYAAGEAITYPALSTKSSVSQITSDFFLYNRAYIRLKTLEIAYTLPAIVARKITADNVRLLVSGQNLLTWDHMKTKDFGPEGGGFTSIPVYRVYNVGLNVGF